MQGISRLLEIMAQLRDPEGGCPWDLEQDFQSISPFTIEEAYEVDAAIAGGDLDAIRDELGDLLFQVVFQARIAEELGAFDFQAVADAISRKLVRRHPHVFADAETPSTLEAQSATWESIKAAERAAAGSTLDLDGPPDPFEDVPRSLPALARSAKLAGRMELHERSMGKEVEASARDQLARARRALVEAESALAPEEPAADRGRRLQLVGEGLRAWAGLARALGVDPEQALRQADDERVEAAREASRRANVHQAGNSPLR